MSLSLTSPFRLCPVTHQNGVPPFILTLFVVCSVYCTMPDWVTSLKTLQPKADLAHRYQTNSLNSASTLHVTVIWVLHSLFLPPLCPYTTSSSVHLSGCLRHYMTGTVKEALDLTLQLLWRQADRGRGGGGLGGVARGGMRRQTEV